MTVVKNFGTYCLLRRSDILEMPDGDHLVGRHVGADLCRNEPINFSLCAELRTELLQRDLLKLLLLNVVVGGHCLLGRY